VEGSGYYANAFTIGSVGSGEGANAYTGVVVAYDSSSVRAFLTGVADTRVVGSGPSPLTAADVYYALDFIVPMTGWQP